MPTGAFSETLEEEYIYDFPPSKGRYTVGHTASPPVLAEGLT